MILVFEMVWTGTHHAPGNSVTVQTIAAAFPGQAVRVHADPSHLHELQADPALTALGNVSLRPIAVSRHFRGRPQIVSLRRFLRELATLRAALRQVPAGEPVLLMLLSATPTAIFAADLLARLARRPMAVQVGLHGNLNDAFGWRPRNPLARARDLHAALATRHGGRVRFLVLEPSIRDELARRIPQAAPATDVLPLPVNLAEVAMAAPPTLGEPLRIGLVGQATEAKGIGPFLELARHFRQTRPNAVEFHLVGRAAPGSDATRFAPLAHAVPTDPLSRADFQARLAALHYICLPLQPQYYTLSASGALIDAITWLRPVIATRLPIVTDLFDRFGDLGHLCDDTPAMIATIEALLANPDPIRYAAQVAAMTHARDSRMPDALAHAYHRLIVTGFPSLGPAFALAPPAAI